ncbi:hypothetical protein TNCT_484011 [Trichonephila clavata]|uniref:Uncharacterized protein n=1 Tax=Trichonephila clavata TaxID=2740835 RepID=A0A8X6HEU8_TRICU|nr:hypothetical protein TNCT_484011 [Trichonephila clavata]
MAREKNGRNPLMQLIDVPIPLLDPHTIFCPPSYCQSSHAMHSHSNEQDRKEFVNLSLIRKRHGRPLSSPKNSHNWCRSSFHSRLPEINWSFLSTHLARSTLGR